MRVLVALIFLTGLLTNCCDKPTFRNIDGFSETANNQVREFLKRTSAEKGRKVAVFDGDGTVLGQVPHYLADECMYEYADLHPDRHPNVIREIKTQSNVSLPYVQGRVRFFSGLRMQELRDMGDDCFRRNYADKVFPQMKSLIQILGKNDFEVWIITASPEALYQKFLSRELNIPETHIIGVKSIIKNDVITDQMIQPIPQEEGKKIAIETFVQAQPLLAAGNSRGDREMIEYSRGLRIIVNPDEKTQDGKESLADYARKNAWLILPIRDVTSPRFPSVSAKKFGVRTNETHDVP